MKKILLTTAICTSIVFAASNPSKQYSYELTPFASGILTDSNPGLADKNYANAGLSLGKNLTGYFIDQVELGYMRSDSLKYEGTNGNTNVNRLFLNAVKKFALTEKLAAYGLAGIGYQNVSQELADHEDSPFFNYGIGLKYDIPYYGIALKGDVRHLITTKNSQNDIMYTLGLAMPLGSKPRDVVAPVVPTVAQEAVAPIVEGDDDKDGVLNSKDLCPNTVAGAIVDENGCELDDDKDGVLNKFDKCPNTSPGVKVNTDGCVDTVNLNINFDTNSANIKDKYNEKLNAFAVMMKENPSLTAVIEAHTDSKGSESYNQNLSAKRAQSTVDALKALNIDTTRLKAVGYGESQPIATNETKEGRAENRRVTALLNQ